MKQRITEVQTMKTVEKHYAKYLDKIGKPGERIRERALFISAQAANYLFPFFPDGKIASGRETAAKAKKQSLKLEKLSKQFNFRVDQTLRQEAQRLKSSAEYFHKLVERHGRADHDEGISVVVMNVLDVKPDFNEWKALSKVIAGAYRAVGRKIDAENIYADKLAREAKRLYRDGVVQAGQVMKKRAAAQ